MEESDFEEESTHSYVSCVEHDVALSYILENVLGHFQKDLEGGVSAENLGAKFGDYCSFLSMYQRSPICYSIPMSTLEAETQMVQEKLKQWSDFFVTLIVSQVVEETVMDAKSLTTTSMMIKTPLRKRKMTKMKRNFFLRWSIQSLIRDSLL